MIKNKKVSVAKIKNKKKTCNKHISLKREKRFNFKCSLRNTCKWNLQKKVKKINK